MESQFAERAHAGDQLLEDQRHSNRAEEIIQLFDDPSDNTDTAPEATSTIKRVVAAGAAGLTLSGLLYGYLRNVWQANKAEAPEHWSDGMSMSQIDESAWLEIITSTPPTVLSAPKKILPAPSRPSKLNTLLTWAQLHTGTYSGAIGHGSTSGLSSTQGSSLTTAVSQIGNIGDKRQHHARDQVYQGRQWSTADDSNLAYRAYTETESPRTATISMQELESELTLIDSLKIPDSSTYFHTAHRNTDTKRARRDLEIAPPVTRHPVFESSIVQAFSDTEYPENMRVELDRILKKAYDNANKEDDVSIVSLLYGTISLLMAFQRNHANRLEFNTSYHFSVVALRDLWRFADQTIDDDDIDNFENFENFRQEILDRKWDEHRTHAPVDQSNSRNGDENGDDDELSREVMNEYLHWKMPQWAPYKLSPSDRIVIHTQNEARSYSIAEVLFTQHLEMESNHSNFYHFEFDQTGLHDEDLNQFMELSKNGGFTYFKDESPSMQPDNYYSDNANTLWQRHLGQTSTTPMNFQREEKLQQIINGMVTPAPDTKGDRARKETITELLNLIMAEKRPDIIEESMLAYANSLILNTPKDYLKELKPEQLLDMDYIYRYRDQFSREQYSTATLAEFLNIRINSTHLPITQRVGVSMLWPAEFNPELITYLQKSTRQVGRIWREMAISTKLTELRNELSRHIPSLDENLRKINAEISKKNNVHKTSLSDEIEFEYKIIPHNKLRQPIINNSSTSVRKTFTVRAILIGEQSRWRMKNYAYDHESIRSINKGILRRKSQNYVKELQEYDTQNKLLALLENARNDKAGKEIYQRYINVILSLINRNQDMRYEFPETPLIGIYPDISQQELLALNRQYQQPSKIGHVPQWHALLQDRSIPIHVISMLNGQKYAFKSFNDMKREIGTNNELKAFFKIHLPFDFGDNFNALTLNGVDDVSNFYERFIDWQSTNIDKIVKSQGEATAFTVLEIISDFSIILSLPAFFMGPYAGFAFGAMLSAGPKLLQAAISDNQQNRATLLEEALLNLVLEGAGAAAGAAIGKAIKTGIQKVMARQARSINLTNVNLPLDDPALKNMADSLAIACAGRTRRGVSKTMCRVFSKKRHTKANENADLRTDRPQPQDIRFKEPLRQVSAHSSRDLPEYVQKIVDDFLKNEQVTKMIASPREKCIIMAKKISSLILQSDPEAVITYRAMLLWKKSTHEGSFADHFVAIYEKDGKRFVFDLTAQQFESAIPTLKSWLVLPEPAWIEQYQSAVQFKTIKYKDFSDINSAQNEFSGFAMLYEAWEPRPAGCTLLTVDPKLRDRAVSSYV